MAEMDMLSGIAAAMQRVMQIHLPSRIESVTSSRETGKGSNDKGKDRHFMLGLRLWMQARSDEGDTMVVSVDRTDKFDRSPLSVDCSQEEFSTIEASPHQVLRRTAEKS